MSIKVDFNYDEFRKGVLAAYKDQLPFATSLAINRTGKQAIADLRDHARSVFTVRGTYTTRNITMTAGNKRNPTATVGGVPDYLRLQAEGGIKTGKSRAVPTAHVRTSPTVRVTKSKYPASLAKRGGNRKPFFVTFDSGKAALVQRRTKKRLPLKTLYLFPKHVVVRKRFQFIDVVSHTVDERLEKNMLAAIDEALRTAR